MNVLSTGPSTGFSVPLSCPRVTDETLKDLQVRALATRLLHRVGCPGAMARLDWVTLDDYLKHVLGHLESGQGEGISLVSFSTEGKPNTP